MRTLLIIAIVLLFASFYSVNNQPKSTPIDGGWELVWGKYSGGERNTGKPFQFKLFSGKHYALIMEDNEGKWSSSVAGSYVLNGNIYRETVQYASPNFPKEVIGLTMDWKYEIKGDTLFMEGPLKVVDTKGNDLSASMGGLNSMKEKRVRAR